MKENSHEHGAGDRLRATIAAMHADVEEQAEEGILAFGMPARLAPGPDGMMSRDYLAGTLVMIDGTPWRVEVTLQITEEQFISDEDITDMLDAEDSA